FDNFTSSNFFIFILNSLLYLSNFSKPQLNLLKTNSFFDQVRLHSRAVTTTTTNKMPVPLGLRTTATATKGSTATILTAI
ncbi:hypothetical protein INT47_005718, partial [Mucor saturninus]